MTTLDPTIQHTAGVENLIEKMTGKPIPAAPGMTKGATQAEPKQSLSDLVMGAMVPEQAPQAPVEEPQVQESPEQVEAAPEVEAPPPAPQPAKPRLARSAEIQRRAAEAQRRARVEANRLRARPAPKAAQQQVDPLAEQRAALQAEKEQIAKIRASLDSEVRLAQTNPLGFASRHGVSGAAMAQFVRDGSDPNKLAIERLRQDASQAIAQVEERANQRIAAIQEAFAQSEEARVQNNFYTFVEDAKAANPEAFAALNSGLVYSDKDVWDTANRLMEEDADLRDNFDEDRLLEAVESEARRDPRWVKVQQLTKQATSNKQPKQSATRVESNVRAKEEVAEPPQPREPAPARQSPGTRDPSTGQFVPQRTTPFDRHQVHIDSLLRSGRIGIR